MQKEHCLFVVHCLTEGGSRHVVWNSPQKNCPKCTGSNQHNISEWASAKSEFQSHCRVLTVQVDGNTKHMVSMVTLCLQRGSKQTWNKYKLAVQGCVKAVQNITPCTYKQTLKVVSENAPNMPKFTYLCKIFLVYPHSENTICTHSLKNKAMRYYHISTL